jgi:heterodisulfide reductase subunit C
MALRKLAMQSGYYMESEKGRQQYVLVKDLCGNILNHGYCIYPRNFDYDEHKEYGTVGKWINENLDDLHKRMGSNLDGDGPGGLRKIPQESLDQLKKIFDITGATELMNKVIDDAHLQAEKENLSDEDYFKKVYITNNSSKHLNNG